MPPRARVKEQDRTRQPDLVIPVVDDDRYANAAALDADRYRYAALDADRYRYAAAGDADRYRAPVTGDANRYAAAGWGRYADRSRYTRPGRKMVRRTILVLPPHRTQGELLWIPAGEYERCFEEWGEDPVWQLGSVVDFDYALESLHWQQGGFDVDEEDKMQICMVAIDDESETQEADGWWGEERPLDLIEQALALRAEIAKDPDLVAEVLEIGDLIHLTDVAGLATTPVPMEVADAIANDPVAGLGGAAVDHAVWRMAGSFGPPGARFAEAVDIQREEEGLWLNPTENFLLYSGSLPPDAAPVPGLPPHRRLYAMTGDYVVSKANYVSDLSGQVIGGWRSCWLEPIPKLSAQQAFCGPETYPERS